MIEFIFIGMVLVSSVSAYGVYKYGVPTLLKMLTLPSLVLLGSVMGWFWYQELGKPRYWEPEGEWTYVHHVAQGTKISLWVIQDGTQRLYVFNYDDDTQEELDRAQEQTRQGVQVEGEFKEDKGEGTEVTDGRLSTIVKPDPPTAKNGG